MGNHNILSSSAVGDEGATQVPSLSAPPEVVPIVMDEKATLQVVAPATMRGGYQFTVEEEAGNKTVLVEVPPGGIREGDSMQAIVISETIHRSHKVPSGAWRDGLWNCCAHGFCHPHVWISWCLPSCMLGQIITRMRLDLWGRPMHGRKTRWSAFRVILILTISYSVISYLLWILAETLCEETSGRGHEIFLESFRFVLGLLFSFFVILAGSRTRWYLRKRYGIPASCCGKYEDCVCATFCLPLAVGQMARHTADYREYEASWISETGLKVGAPEVV